jgi:hypothetical protein
VHVGAIATGLGKALDGRDLARPSARKAGTRQEWNGLPSIHTVQAPQSPASQPFLDAEDFEVAQEGAQALAGLRVRPSSERPLTR